MSATSIPIVQGKTKHHASDAKQRLIRRIKLWYINYRTRKQLSRLPDSMLKDIGVSRIDAEQEASKVFWKD
ncbi:DUF1127 domain-containing protein [Marinobacter sp.]|uniref:DUF1127 domain-containing protein n=1 Tax=Marinobacter sp. TaxID=50741 RepID=UPI002B49AAC0|nr:DUF1127 domain-containing protein [Marinobacter sp.]HKK56325.1 DUF1127 domain-containing protein [Marinobacter sp.]